MPPKVLNVSEARRLLPGLVRNAEHSGAIGIGARGHAAAILVGVHDYEELWAKASRAGGGTGWARLKLQVTSTIEDVEAELLALRQERAAGLKRTRKKRRALVR